MNNRTNTICAIAIAACTCGGCATYPEHRAYNGAPYGHPTYVTPAASTSTIYVEQPYYYYDGGYYYDEHGRRHHRHDSGPQHGYGMGPVMPPRGAGPARRDTHSHDRNGHRREVLHEATKALQIENTTKANAAKKAATVKLHTMQNAANFQQRAAQNAANTQLRTAQNAATAQHRAAQQRAAQNAAATRRQQHAIQQTPRSYRRFRK